MIQMLSLTVDEVEQRARDIIKALETSSLKLEITSGESTLGGGAGPTSNVPITLIAITHQEKSAQEIEQQLRASTPPIIGRISEGKVLLDLRTVFVDQLPALHQALKTV